MVWDPKTRTFKPRVLPTWWLCFLGAFCMVPAITNSIVLPLLLPPLIEGLVGQARKAACLGVLSSVVYVLGLSMPFLGTLSDKIGHQPWAALKLPLHSTLPTLESACANSLPLLTQTLSDGKPAYCNLQPAY